jgi:hypothetical protein
MKQKTFTKREVEKKIEKVLNKLETKKLLGKQFILKGVIGDYQFNSRNRYIKEVLFSNMENHGRSGSIWRFNYPKDKKYPTRLAKKVMEAKNATTLNT